MADREKKNGKMETQKIKYLENEKSSLDEIKNIFHSFFFFEGLSFGDKKKWTQALI